MTVPAMQGRLAAIRRFAAGLQTRRLPASGQRRLPIYGQRRSLQTRRAAPHRMLELVLVRHGESEGNIAYRRSVQGDTSLYSAEAGAWLEKHAAPTFDAFYTSEYLRAMETAGLLRLDGASWKTECNLRERDWGAWDLTPPSRRFEPEDARRKRHGLYFAPSGGESLAQVLLRVDSMLEFLHRHMVDRRVLMVCHGEIMWAFRLRFERLNQITYRDLADELSESERIDNGSVLRYSRQDPETGKTDDEFKWFQLATPWKPEFQEPPWRSLDKEDTSYSNDELLKLVERFPRLYKSSLAEPIYPIEQIPEPAGRDASMAPDDERGS